MQVKRCDWVPNHDPLYMEYHDCEWGVPVWDDQRMFEFLILESFQAGLSWRTVLYKRENFRKAFANFSAEKMARMGERDIQNLLQDKGIIRNRLKIEAAIANARLFLRIREKYGSFCTYLWGFVDGKPIINHWRSMEELPARSELSDTISKDLKQNGFRFVGSTIVYAHMQATGMVNDHLVYCFRHDQLNENSTKIRSGE